MPDAPEEIRALAERRQVARRAREFAAADMIRDRIAEAGWAVVDDAAGWRLEEIPRAVVRRVPAGEVGSVLDEPASADVTLTWVVEGWPEDVDRAIASFRSAMDDRRLQLVVADVTGEPEDRWGDDVELVSLESGTGWAAARNAGLRRARGEMIVALDGSVEAIGDVDGPLRGALGDPSIGVCGPFGIVTEDLREFHRVDAPADCDAVEGYLMAFRRETLIRVGGFDERFTWYRSADIEWSFRVRDAGLRVVAVPVPVRTHEHRMWEALAPHDREARSRRNFSRFLDSWRGRSDLTMRGRPPPEETPGTKE
jgi:hypothetical protein